MHQDQNARLGGQRNQLLQMALGGYQKQLDGDVSRSTLRTGSPSLQADDIPPQGYLDIDAMGSQMFGSPGANQLRRAAEEAFAAQHLEDRCATVQFALIGPYGVQQQGVCPHSGQ